MAFLAAIKSFIAKRRISFPLWLLIFLSACALPLFTETIAQEGEEKSNKYDVLQDDVAYVSVGYDEYVEIKGIQGMGDSQSYYREIQQTDGEYILYVISSFEKTDFGFPYLEGAYIRFSNDVALEKGKYYSNFSLNDETISYKSESYERGGQLQFSIPYLNVYDDVSQIQKICLLCVEEKSLTGLANLDCCFDCSLLDAETRQAHFANTDFGRAIKRSYDATIESFINTTFWLSLIPSVALIPVLIIFTALTFRLNKKDSLVAFLYYRKKSYLFGDIGFFNLISIVSPAVIGALFHSLIAVLLGISVNLPLCFALIGLVLVLAASSCFIQYFSVTRGRGKLWKTT